MTREEWDERVSHPMQSWVWGEFREKVGNKISRVSGDNQYLVIWSRIPLSPWCFGYIPMGPVPTDGDVKLLTAEAEKLGAIGIRMEPNEKAGTRLPSGLIPGRHLFKPKTFWLNLDKSEEEILKAMHPKCRYNIRVAERHEVRVAETASGLEDYLMLMFGGTTKRQKIYSHNQNYHRLMWETLKASGVASMFTAKYNDKTVAAWLIFKWKKFMYYAYGGFDDNYRRVMAPVLGIWEIIKWGKAREFKVFDLWGAEEGKGFSRFKECFGPDVVEMVGTFDLPVKLRLYPAFRLAEEIRWKVLRALK